MTTPAQANAASKIYYETTDPGDLVYRASVLLHFMLRGFDGKYDAKAFKNSLVSPSDLVGGGRQYEFQTEIALANASGLDNTTVADLSDKQMFTWGYGTMGSLISSVTMFHDEMIKNSEPSKVFDLVSKKLQNAQKSAQDTLAKALLQWASENDGVLTSPFMDLFYAAGTTTAYLGLQEADVALWDANFSSAAKTMGFALMQELAREAKVDGTTMGQPNLYITSQTLLDSYEAGFDTKQIVRDEAAMSSGWYNIVFRNAPIVADVKFDVSTDGILSRFAAKTGTGYGPTSVMGLNTNYLKLKVHKDENMKATEWMSAPNQPQNMSSSVLSSQMMLTTHRDAHIHYDAVSAA